MRKFRAIISMLLAFVLVVSVITIAVVSTGVVSAASAAPSLSLSNKYNGIRGKWTAVSGASHYIVYFRRASETQWSSDIAYSLQQLLSAARHRLSVYGAHAGRELFLPAPCAQRSEQSVFRCEQDHLCAAVPNGGQPLQSNLVQEYPCRMGSGHRGDAVHGLFQIGVVCFLAQRTKAPSIRCRCARCSAAPPVCIPRSQASSPKSSRSCFFDKPIIKQ